jgi:hypothetical protein
MFREEEKKVKVINLINVHLGLVSILIFMIMFCIGNERCIVYCIIPLIMAGIINITVSCLKIYNGLEIKKVD